ncbi:MAG: hypothetical protein H7Y37_00225 [Anaerolineae bacterium]|nr:hypothetical protein [Gloeobacterales cyanobacterium ES-bin-313]
MYSAGEIYYTAELDNIPSIPDHHFTDIDLDDIEDEDEGDNDDYSPVYPMPFFKPDKSDEDLEPNHNDEDLEPNLEDLEPSDDFGGSFPLSVEYDDDQPEPTDIDQDDW